MITIFIFNYSNIVIYQTNYFKNFRQGRPWMITIHTIVLYTCNKFLSHFMFHKSLNLLNNCKENVVWIILAAIISNFFKVQWGINLGNSILAIDVFKLKKSDTLEMLKKKNFNAFIICEKNLWTDSYFLFLQIWFTN